MTAPKLRTGDFLNHILEAIHRIRGYTQEIDEVGFLSSSLLQDAAVRNIEVIGEAANNIRKYSPDFAKLHAHVPWEVMYAMRNSVAHGYHNVDFSLVWKTIETELPQLESEVKKLVPQA